MKKALSLCRFMRDLFDDLRGADKAAEREHLTALTAMVQPRVPTHVGWTLDSVVWYGPCRHCGERRVPLHAPSRSCCGECGRSIGGCDSAKRVEDSICLLHGYHHQSVASWSACGPTGRSGDGDVRALLGAGNGDPVSGRGHLRLLGARAEGQPAGGVEKTRSHGSVRVRVHLQLRDFRCAAPSAADRLGGSGKLGAGILLGARVRRRPRPPVPVGRRHGERDHGLHATRVVAPVY